jgi:carbamoyltransferase
MKILGISAFYHDSAAVLIEDGRIVAAAQEERFTRVKQDSNFPARAIQFCLKQAGIDADQIDHVVFYEKPFLKFERLLETYLSFAPRGFGSFRLAIPVWLREKLFQKNLLKKELVLLGFSKSTAERVLFTEHHQSHAASAFYCSPFEEAIVLTMDGVGEWATTSVSIGKGRELKMVREIHFPHSLGLLYSAFTYYAGFKVNSGEYKLMGLAPYGTPKYEQLIREHLIDVKPDGSFRLDLSYFDYCVGLRMTSEKFHRLFGGPPRKPEEPITQRDMDLAASIQKVLEDIIFLMTRSLRTEFGIENLCLAGGVALNCVANGKILRDGRFKKIWIQPAAGDAGGALGAALACYHDHLLNPRVLSASQDLMKGAFLGPSFSQKEILESLQKAGAIFKEVNEDQLIELVTDALNDGQSVGWFQGRMEFGPRALGARSILGDARSPSMQSTLNLRIKYRESFRPFAPSILREDLKDWFDLDEDSPYMLLVADVAKSRILPMTEEQRNLFGIEKLRVPRSTIPAVTHVDYSARVQTVHPDTNPLYHRLLKKFKDKTGCPVLVNTSFNVRGEPIVCSPEDAFRCFMGTELEVLAIGGCLLRKQDQDQTLIQNYKNHFALD